MSTVLFVCRQNAGRSQMSQALFERASGGRHQALSAGTTPGAHVHPEVVEVMRELGIDLAGRSLDQVRAVRDDIDQRVRALADELDNLAESELPV
jgi:protein-tyrosine-phosphatase